MALAAAGTWRQQEPASVTQTAAAAEQRVSVCVFQHCGSQIPAASWPALHTAPNVYTHPALLLCRC